MKRSRPDRPSGRPKAKQRRRCPVCDRFMSRVERGWWKTGQRTWMCRGCHAFYGYMDGVLKGVAGRGADWYESRGKWRMVPEGMLMVGDGEPCD